ncbi:MAG: histidine kinase [Rhizobacter sp.]
MPAPLSTRSTPLTPKARRRGLQARATVWALILALLGFVAFAFTAFANRTGLLEVVQRTAEQNNAVETLLLVERVNGLLIDIEAGQRGFLAVDQSTTLQYHRDNLDKLLDMHTLLFAELSFMSNRAEPVLRLDALVRRRIEQAEEMLENYRIGNDEIPLEVDDENTIAVVSAIRFEIERIKAEQTGRINWHREAIAHVQERTNRLSIALPAIGTALMAAAAAGLIYERGRRDSAEAALRRANATLEQRVDLRTEQLQAALKQIQSFALELDHGIEAERRRMAREVHDQFGQVATALRLMVLGLRKAHRSVPEQTVQEMVTLIDEAINVARRIAAELRPPLLDDLGLGAAVEHFAATLERQSGMQIRCDVSDDTVLSANQANQLFRILQEATTNVLRHASANEIRIDASVEDSHYRLEITDNGVGPGAVRADAAGLRNMEERAQLIGASFSFGPGAVRGASVAVLVPISPGSSGGQET